MWTRVTSSQLLDQYMTILWQEPAYVDATKQSTARIIDRPGGELWIYDDGATQVALGVFQCEPGVKCRLVNCVPAGAVSRDTAKLIIRQIRSIMDRQDIEDWEVILLENYTRPEMQTLVEGTYDFVWEVSKQPRRIKPGVRKIEYSRPRARREEDEDFHGERKKHLRQARREQRGQQ